MSEDTSVRFDMGEPIWMAQVFHRSYGFDSSGVWGVVLNGDDEETILVSATEQFIAYGGNPALIDRIELMRLDEPNGDTAEE